MNLRRLSLLIALGLIPLGQLERLQLAGGMAVYFHEIFLGIFVLLQLPWLLKQPLSKAFALLQLLIVASILLHFQIFSKEIIAPLAYLARFDLYIAAAFCTYGLIKQGLVKTQYLLHILILAAVIVAILGWLQYCLIPDTRFLVYLGWDDHYLRLISTLLDPGFTGIFLAFGLLLLERHTINGWSKLTLPRKLVAILSGALLFSALLFTYSRASYLAYVVGNGWLWLNLRSKRYVFILLTVLFVVGMFLLPRPRSEGTRLERTASVTARITTVQKGIAVNSVTEAIFGRGWYASKLDPTHTLQGIQVPVHPSAPENSFVFIFESLGVVGIAIFAWWLQQLARETGRMSDFWLLSVAAGTHALFTNTLFYAFVLFFLGVVWATSKATVKENR